MNSRKNQKREQERSSSNSKNLSLLITQKQVFNSKNSEAKLTYRLESSLGHRNKKLITKHQSSTFNYEHNRIIQYNSAS